jgi:hypothetical protein
MSNPLVKRDLVDAILELRADVEVRQYAQSMCLDRQIFATPGRPEARGTVLFLHGKGGCGAGGAAVAGRRRAARD